MNVNIEAPANSKQPIKKSAVEESKKTPPTPVVATAEAKRLKKEDLDKETSKIKKFKEDDDEEAPTTKSNKNQLQIAQQHLVTTQVPHKEVLTPTK